LVTGKVPFPGDNHLDVVEKKKGGEFTPAGELNAAVPRMLDEILARMLAREPQDRYQTVSELIVDLERSRLAARVPEYADPEQALQDPWVRARLTTTAHPTRPDIDARRPTPANGAPVTGGAQPEELWSLRFRNKAGRPRKGRGHTNDIVERLRTGRLPADAEARRTPEGPFRPLLSFAEFRDVAVPKRARNRASRRRKRSGNNLWWLAGTIGGALTFIAFLIYLLSR